MPLIAEYAKRFGVYDNLPAYLSLALGAGETTVLRMVTAYSMFANGGKRINPTLIDRIQDRYGHTIYQARPARLPRLRRRRMAGPGRADPGRQARAGARSDDRLPDHLDDGRRRAARHRAPWSRRSASRSPARPAPPTTRRTPGSSASRPTSWSASTSATTSRAHRPRRDRRPSGGADRHRLPEDGARRQAGGAVPRAGRHQAHPRRRQDRHARRARRRRRRHPRSLQAGHRRRPTAIRSIGYTDQQQASRGSFGASPDADRAVRRGTGLY